MTDTTVRDMIVCLVCEGCGSRVTVLKMVESEWLCSECHIKDDTYPLRCPNCGYAWGVEAKEKPPYQICPMCGAKVEIE